MKISVITPSFNQGIFIERTIASIAAQRSTVDVEHIVVDGGSTDDTLDILKRHEDHITWISEPDEGQSDAINKGFHMATGDILAWLNSDDTYEPGSLQTVTETFSRTGCSWCFGNCRNIDEHDHEIRRSITRYKNWQSRNYSYRRLLRRLSSPNPQRSSRGQPTMRSGPYQPTCTTRWIMTTGCGWGGRVRRTILISTWPASDGTMRRRMERCIERRHVKP